MLEILKTQQSHANYSTSAMENGTGAMENRDHFKNGASMKNLMSRGSIIISIGFFLLIFFFLLTGCSKPTPIDVNSDNLEEYVSIGVNKHLDRAVKLNAITQYQRAPIRTSTESFKEIAQKYAADGATLHPNLTYKIKYLEGGVDGREKECEAMAYSVVKDGKLLGSGVVFSEVLATTAWEKIWAFGDNSIGGVVINWKSAIFGLIVILLVAWFGSRLVLGYASTLSPKRPQNECPRCGNQRFTVNAGEFFRCINCNNVWKK